MDPCEYRLVIGDRACRRKKKPTKVTQHAQTKSKPKPEVTPHLLVQTAIVKKKETKSVTTPPEQPTVQHETQKESFDKGCHVQLLKKHSQHSRCIHGETFGCSQNQVWVSSSCSGEFRCNGKKVSCFGFSHRCNC